MCNENCDCFLCWEEKSLIEECPTSSEYFLCQDCGEVCVFEEGELCSEEEGFDYVPSDCPF